MDGLAFSDQPQDSSFQPPKRELVSQREFARRMEVVESAVSKGKAAGRLPPRCWQGRKLIFEEARKAWKSSADTRGGKRGDLAEQAAPAVESAEERAAAESYRATKQRQEIAKAEILEMDLAEKRDQLRPKAEVKRAVTTLYREFRQKLDGIPTWAADVAALTGADPAEVAALLKVKTRQLEAEIAAHLEKVGDTSDDAVDA